MMRLRYTAGWGTDGNVSAAELAAAAEDFRWASVRAEEVNASETAASPLSIPDAQTVIGEEPS